MRGGIAHGHTAELEPGAAAGTALVDRGCRVTHDDADLVEPDVQLIGDDLRDCRLYSQADIDLSEIADDRVIGLYSDPGIKLRRGERRLYLRTRVRGLRSRRRVGVRRSGEISDNEGADGEQRLAPA
jgi:hypothetical protein